MGGTRLLVACSLSALVFSCSGAEQQVVGSFLTAVQGGDEATVSGISLVEFPGTVTSWEIIEVGPESKEPFTLSALRSEFVELEKNVESKTKLNEDYLQLHADKYREIQRLLERNPERTLTGELATFKSDWDVRMEEHEKLAQKLEEVRQQIIDLRSAAGLSLNTSVNDNFAGDITGKVVRLKINDGSNEKTYRFTLQRYELSDKERNLKPMSRWIITEIEEGDA